MKILNLIFKLSGVIAIGYITHNWVVVTIAFITVLVSFTDKD